MMLLALVASAVGTREAKAQLFRVVSRPDTTVYLVQVSVPGENLAFKRRENSYAAQYEIGLDVQRKRDVVFSDYRRFGVTQETPVPRDTLLVFDFYLPLPDDSYEFTVKARDLNSGRSLLEKSIKTRRTGEGLKIGDPLPVATDSEGIRVEGPWEKDTLRFMLSAYSEAPETLSVLWRLVWESEKELLKEDSAAWPLAEGGDTMLILLGARDLSAGDFLLKVEIRRDHKTVATRGARFHRQGINILSAKEFRTVLSGLEFLYPGKTKALASAPPGERERAWEEFWRSVDPTPETDFNEAKEAFLSRYPTVRANFRRFDGALGDMGKIYLKYGRPDDIERHPFELNTWPYEVWFYNSLAKVFVFVDKGGFGQYELVPPGLYGQFGF